MNRVDLSKEIAAKTGLSQKDALKYIDLITDAIIDSMERGDKVEIRGFGSFTVKNYDAREGRNPKSGEKILIPAKRLPAFKAGKDLKEKLNA